MRVEFGEWRPDLADVDVGASQIALNVLPALGQYIPAREVYPFTSALAARPLGGISGKNAAGDVFTYAATSSAIYELASDGTWTDVKKSGGYSTPSGNRWSFARFGTYIVATDFDANVQVYEMGVSSAFADLGGTPPKARWASVLRDFLFLCNQTSAPDKASWSAINDITGWTSGTDQSGEQTFPDVGENHGLFGFNVGYMFFDRAIYRVSYVGPPLIWRFDKVSDGRGAISNGGIAQFGNQIFFLADDGFFQWEGEQAIPIGHEKIDKTIQDILNTNAASNISAAIDPVQKTVIWSIPSLSDPNGFPDMLLVYSWVTQRWTKVELTVPLLLSARTIGYTLDNLDQLTTNIDTFELSLDDPSLQTQKYQVAAFSSVYRMGPFAGDTLAATLETKDFTLGGNIRTFVSGLWPVCDAENLQCSLGSRDRAANSVTYATAASMEPQGLVPMRQSGRHHRAKMTIAAGESWNSAQAVEFQFTSAGNR